MGRTGVGNEPRVEGEATSRPTLPAPPDTAGRKARPVLWWAAIGVGAVVVQGYVYGAWVFSGDFESVPTGPDPVPHWMKVWAWILQPTMGLLAVAAIVWVLRGCIRERRFTLDAKLMVGACSLIWLDPIGNLIRPQFLFNSYYVNRGSWLPHIPGWISRNGENLPSPILLEFTTYIFLVFLVMAGCAFMGRTKQRWPRMGNVGLVSLTWLMFVTFVIVLETMLVRTGFNVWTSLPYVTIFNGTRWQYPVFPDPPFWGGMLTALTALRYFRDDRGRTVVDRGLDRVAIGDRARTFVSTFAVIGFASVAMLGYTIMAIPAALYAGPTWPNLPSHYLNGICGPGSPYKCPGPKVPILLPTTPLTSTAAR